MKEQGREPMKVAIGQRWAPKDGGWSGPSFVINGDNDPRDGHSVKWDKSNGGGYWKPEAILARCTFLGYAPGFGPCPSPEGAGRVMEADADGYPVACLQCGGKRGPYRSFVCVDCFPQPNGISDAMAHAWNRGARDFPRSPAPVPVAKALLDAVKEAERNQPPTYVTGPWIYGRAVGEMRSQDGSPLSALEAIQSCPRPEPWVESCDPLHWLRDA